MKLEHLARAKTSNPINKLKKPAHLKVKLKNNRKETLTKYTQEESNGESNNNNGRNKRKSEISRRSWRQRGIVVPVVREETENQVGKKEKAASKRSSKSRRSVDTKDKDGNSREEKESICEEKEEKEICTVTDTSVEEVKEITNEDTSANETTRTEKNLVLCLPKLPVLDTIESFRLADGKRATRISAPRSRSQEEVAKTIEEDVSNTSVIDLDPETGKGETKSSLGRRPMKRSFEEGDMLCIRTMKKRNRNAEDSAMSESIDLTEDNEEGGEKITQLRAPLENQQVDGVSESKTEDEQENEHITERVAEQETEHENELDDVQDDGEDLDIEKEKAALIKEIDSKIEIQERMAIESETAYKDKSEEKWVGKVG